MKGLKQATAIITFGPREPTKPVSAAKQKQGLSVAKRVKVARAGLMTRVRKGRAYTQRPLAPVNQRTAVFPSPDASIIMDETVAKSIAGTAMRKAGFAMPSEAKLLKKERLRRRNTTDLYRMNESKLERHPLQDILPVLPTFIKTHSKYISKTQTQVGKGMLDSRCVQTLFKAWQRRSFKLKSILEKSRQSNTQICDCTEVDENEAYAHDILLLQQIKALQKRDERRFSESMITLNPILGLVRKSRSTLSHQTGGTMSASSMWTIKDDFLEAEQREAGTEDDRMCREHLTCPLAHHRHRHHHHK